MRVLFLLRLTNTDFDVSLLPQTRREKIGPETGSSKFQLLEKD